MKYTEFKKQAAWFDDEEPVKKPINRWGQVDVMDETGTMVPAQFDPSAYADAHVAAIEEKRKARNKELEPDEREGLYQQYLDEGMQYGDWNPPYNSVNDFLQLSPTDAMQAYEDYIDSYGNKFTSGTDEEGNYWSKLEPNVPRDIIDAKFGGYDALDDRVIGPKDSEERKALYRHLLSGLPTDTYDDMKEVVRFMRSHPVSDEEYRLRPAYALDGGFPTAEQEEEAERAWVEEMKDYLQRNVYDHLPKPEDPNQITAESGVKDNMRYINAYNNRGKNWGNNTETGTLSNGMRYVQSNNTQMSPYSRTRGGAWAKPQQPISWDTRTPDPVGTPRQIAKPKSAAPQEQLATNIPMIKQQSYSAFKKIASTFDDPFKFDSNQAVDSSLYNNQFSQDPPLPKPEPTPQKSSGFGLIGDAARFIGYDPDEETNSFMDTLGNKIHEGKREVFGTALDTLGKLPTPVREGALDAFDAMTTPGTNIAEQSKLNKDFFTTDTWRSLKTNEERANYLTRALTKSGLLSTLYGKDKGGNNIDLESLITDPQKLYTLPQQLLDQPAFFDSLCDAAGNGDLNTIEFLLWARNGGVESTLFGKQQPTKIAPGTGTAQSAPRSGDDSYRSSSSEPFTPANNASQTETPETSKAGINIKLSTEQTYKVCKAATKAFWNSIQQDPMNAFPMAASMFLDYIGLNGIGSWMRDPLHFYLALGTVLLGGGFLLFGGGDSKQDAATKQTIVVNNGQQQQDPRLSRIPYSGTENINPIRLI